MEIDWSALATISAPVIALFVGAALNRALERRPRLITYLGHVSAHRIEPEPGNPIDVYTHSVVIKNAGASPARNVRLTHSNLPHFIVYPSVQYSRDLLPSGEIDVVFPILVPRQEVTVSYLYFPPTTWNQINGPIKSDEGPAKVMRVLPTIQYPAWINAIAIGFLLMGIIATLYLVGGALLGIL